MQEWTKGLKTHIRNVIQGAGWKNRDEIIAAFENGEIHFRKAGGGGSFYGLGKKGVLELRAWLGLPTNKPSPKKKTALERAIQLCEAHGYTVTPNAGVTGAEPQAERPR